MAGLNLKALDALRPSLARRIVGVLAAFVLFLGVAGFGVSATGVELDVASMCAGLVCAVAVAVATGALSGRGRAEFMLYGICAAVVVIVCAVLSQSVLAGAASWTNGLIMRVGEHTQMYGLPASEGTGFDKALFCGVAGVVVGLLCSLVSQRGFVAPCVVALACGLAGVVSGWAAAGWWLMALALGTLACICIKAVAKRDNASPRALPWVVACALVACAAIGGGTALGCKGDTADTNALNSALDALVWHAEYGDATFAMPEGQLDDLGPLDAGDQVALTVKTPQPTYEYLRGFVGERYEDGSWSALTADEVMDNRGMLYWLAEDGFASASQLADAARLSEFDDGDDAGIAEATFEYGSVRKPYAYLPYGYSAGGEVQAITDLAQMRLDGQTTQTYSFDTDLTRRAYLLQDAVDEAQEEADGADVADTTEAAEAAAAAAAAAAAGAGSGGAGAQLASLRTYLDDQDAYRTFAEEAYTFVPEEVAELFEKLYGPSTEFTTEQAKIQVLSLLDNTVTYSPDIETENGETDFVEYFLTEARSGCSVHYATAATLLMRYYGIPARYVEGYVLDTASLDAQIAQAEVAEESEESEAPAEAIAAAESVGGETAAPFAGVYKLTERQAHAWVEYYLDGVGWIPFDVTPEWRTAGYYQTTDNTQLVDDSQNWSVGEAQQDAVWTPPEEEVAADEDEAKGLSAIFAEMPFDLLSWPWVLVGFLLTLLIAFIVRDRVLHGRLRRFLSQLGDAQMVPAHFTYLVQLACECGGVKLGNAPFGGQADLLEQAGLCSADLFLRAAHANDCALFAEKGCTTEDAQSVADCIAAVCGSLKRTTSLFVRFWQRHVRCIW